MRSFPVKIKEELRDAYRNGSLSKLEYIQKMHRQHHVLFEYRKFIVDTDVECISVHPNGIFVRSSLHNIELMLDENDQHTVPLTLINFGHYEVLETNFLKAITKKEWIFFDIGANCGWYSLALAKAHPDAGIYAFEPIQNTYAILCRNITHNKLYNIKPYKLGFLDCEKDLEYIYAPWCSGATSLKLVGQPVSAGRNLESIICATTRLDAFCSVNNVYPNIIKCDVEGAEMMVIMGGIDVISRYKPILLLELLRKWSKVFGYHPQDILDLLFGYGYRSFVFSGGGIIPNSLIDEATQETNFLFLHKELHEEIINSYICGG
jgi:FkbM family methyltransferase